MEFITGCGTFYDWFVMHFFIIIYTILVSYVSICAVIYYLFGSIILFTYGKLQRIHTYKPPSFSPKSMYTGYE